MEKEKNCAILEPKKILSVLFCIFIIGTILGRLSEGFYFDYWRLRVKSSDFDIISQPKPIGFEKADTYDFSLNYTAAEDGGYLLLYLYNDESRPENILLHVDLPKGSDQKLDFSYTADRSYHGGCYIKVFPHGDFSYTELNGRSRHILYSDSLFHLIILIAAATLFFIILRKKKNRELVGFDYGSNLFTISFCLILAFISTLPLLVDFLSEADDLSFFLWRIEGIADALREGQFPARINTAYYNGYGHADLIMYPNLILYIPALMRLAGISMLRAYEYTCFFISFITAYITFWTVRRHFISNLTGYIATTFYTLSLYRLSNLFQRGALAEYISMAFLPLVLYGIFEITFSEKPKSRYLILGMTGLLSSHIISTFFGVIICLVVIICGIRNYIMDKRRIVALINAIFITFLLNLWFIIPLLWYHNIPFCIYSDFMRLEPHAVYLPQLFASFIPGSGRSIALGSTEGESGISLGLLFLLTIAAFLLIKSEIKKDRNNDQYRKLVNKGDVFLKACIVSTVLASVIFPWYITTSLPGPLRIFKPVQFAFRFNVFSCIFFSLLAAVTAVIFYRLYLSGKCSKSAFVGICLCLAVINVAPWMDSYTYYRKTVMDNKYSVYPDFIKADYWTSPDDYSRLTGSLPVVISSNEKSTITDYQKTGTHISFLYSGNDNDEIVLPLYYYPGYQAEINGKKIDYTKSPENLIKINMMGNAGKVDVRYMEPWFLLLGDIVTLLTAVSFFVVICRKRNKNM